MLTVTFLPSSKPEPPGDSSLLIFTARVAMLRFPFTSPAARVLLNPGRGGGIRTPIPGFGDRSPNRWTTPLRSKPVLPSEHLLKLFRFFMRRVLPARPAELLGLQAVRMLLLVFCGGVIPILAITTLQRNDFPHSLI